MILQNHEYSISFKLVLAEGNKSIILVNFNVSKGLLRAKTKFWGDPLPPLEGTSKPCQSALVPLQDAISAHLPYWSGLVPLDLTQMVQQAKQPRSVSVPQDSPSPEEKGDAMGGVAEGEEGASLGAVAVGPQDVQVPVGLTGQNRLVVEELESAGHVSVPDWGVPMSVLCRLSRVE